MLEMTLEKILNNRLWDLRLSFIKRYCYITGDSLWLKLAYRGRKKIYSLAYGPYSINDDMWLSQKEYLYRLSKNQI
jgi:hypothetical protein